MYTLPSQRRGIKMAAMAILKFCLSKVLSKHGKRIIFVTSLYFQVVRLERLKADAIHKLNTLMNLAASEQALHLPAAIRGMVWSNTGISNTLNEELLDNDISEGDARTLATRVVDMSPAWIRYDKPNMISDVFDLIFNGSKLVPATA